ncbi:MAG: hypothetical protein V9F03_13820 [Microthrixaceae bacterium]
MSIQPSPPSDEVTDLLPFVELLIGAGNEAIDDGFLNSPAGWYCRMRDPLDFALIREELHWPGHVEVSELHDSVLDRSTWAAVLGPGAEGY